LDIHRKIVGGAKCVATFNDTQMTLSVMLLFEFTSRALGDEGRAECLHRIRKAEEKLDTTLHKHGEHSPQADARHPELKATA
jgi:hypothetical protein